MRWSPRQKPLSNDPDTARMSFWDLRNRSAAATHKGAAHDRLQSMAGPGYCLIGTRCEKSTRRCEADRQEHDDLSTLSPTPTSEIS